MCCTHFWEQGSPISSGIVHRYLSTEIVQGYPSTTQFNRLPFHLSMCLHRVAFFWFLPAFLQNKQRLLPTVLQETRKACQFWGNMISSSNSFPPPCLVVTLAWGKYKHTQIILWLFGFGLSLNTWYRQKATWLISYGTVGFKVKLCWIWKLHVAQILTLSCQKSGKLCLGTNSSGLRERGRLQRGHISVV